ncbi:microcin C transport system substrate-binding protein [Rhodopseudomonas thermotolerans]|uniref:Microcin C transport system substrate-binding protein n=2 Tax=Rhodopseudomonas TaxID=1073 RepID=A0A336JQV7_9BRAD|nr:MULTISPECIES: extracellular solute-binding protein [Rhodopseudomonas]RED30604.1 microcin C transport system substrate-binding protein [Rhodopseudomonas pentothenatexigens]REF92708.1 microcin C transport system substrate-binding protein [Rhodopseudomonas thermotolerans]SSW92137.1 microcin C transport system substrate-binding protein [Rhodopseudomonas pentothenatexigens]
MSLTRRHLLQGGTLAAVIPALGLDSGLFAAGPARAQTAAEGAAWRHGLSLFGDLKYPAGFARFDYVDPKAPRGGAARQIALGTFDNFNIAVAGVKGNIAGAVGYLYETLMTSSLDEVGTSYGLLAEGAMYPDDFSWAVYRLRPEGRWHDGKPVTAEDVVFSFDALKKYSPRYASYYRHVVKAEKVGERDVRFTFDAPGNRELPVIVGELMIMPKHWWEGSDAQGRKRDISATTLEPPLGSAPYKIKEFVAGRSMVLERVKDYWGEKLPVRIGQNNFDELRFEYFRDNTVALEAFKADQADWIMENSAKQWATAYDFPAVTDKRVVKEEFPINDSGRMQAFVLNTRREMFRDARVRRAFNYAFDFEEMNKQLFYGQYKRIASFFEGTELASSGLPQGQELEFLETVRDKVPAELFTQPYTNPVGGNPEAVRANLREAMKLVKEAGFDIKERKLVDRSGKPVVVEMLVQDPSSERIALFYKPSLERLGVTVSIRMVDDAQYQNRVRAFDFDIITDLWGQSLSPGNEQRDYWGSQAADQQGSQNTIGIKNPAVDALIEKVIYAKDRVALVAATRALDRVLLWNFYVVPQFTYGFMRYARWDRFNHAPLPKYARSGLPSLWWYDTDRAAAIGRRS